MKVFFFFFGSYLGVSYMKIGIFPGITFCVLLLFLLFFFCVLFYSTYVALNGMWLCDHRFKLYGF